MGSFHNTTAKLEHCHLKESSYTFSGLDNSIFLLCLHCWFLPLQRSCDCLDAITWEVNGNAPDQSNTSTSGWTEICCWNMIFSLFVEISSLHSKMKINDCICQPRPIYQLVDVTAGWIDFIFFGRRERTAAHICRKQPQICCIRGQRHYLILSYLMVKGLKANLDLKLHHFSAQSMFLMLKPSALECFSCNKDKDLKHWQPRNSTF